MRFALTFREDLQFATHCGSFSPPGLVQNLQFRLATPIPFALLQSFPMHCVTLADLASTLSHHGPNLLYRRAEIPSETLVRYWAASRNRFETWHRTIADFRDLERMDDWESMVSWWKGKVHVLEEILVSEMLTRVVAAIAVGIDEGNHKLAETSIASDECVAPITHGVFLSHVEASNRVHQMMLDRRGSSVEHMVGLNRLRRGVQRWNDVLIGRLSIHSDRKFSYSFDVERAKSFAEEARDCGHENQRDMTTWLMTAAMRDTLARRSCERAASPDLNRKLAASVLQMFRPELFDSLGFPKSMWGLRMQLDDQTAERAVVTESEPVARWN